MTAKKAVIIAAAVLICGGVFFGVQTRTKQTVQPAATEKAANVPKMEEKTWVEEWEGTFTPEEQQRIADFLKDPSLNCLYGSKVMKFSEGGANYYLLRGFQMNKEDEESGGVSAWVLDAGFNQVFHKHFWYPTGGLEFLGIQDVTGDGSREILLEPNDEGAEILSIIEKREDKYAETARLYDVEYAPIYGQRSIEFTDADGDGVLEIKVKIIPDQPYTLPNSDTPLAATLATIDYSQGKFTSQMDYLPVEKKIE